MVCLHQQSSCSNPIWDWNLSTTLSTPPWMVRSLHVRLPSNFSSSPPWINLDPTLFLICINDLLTVGLPNSTSVFLQPTYVISTSLLTLVPHYYHLLMTVTYEWLGTSPTYNLIINVEWIIIFDRCVMKDSHPLIISSAYFSLFQTHTLQ